MEIFSLVGKIMVDSNDAQNSIQKTSDKAESFGTKLGNGIKTAGKWAVGVAGAAASVGAAMVKAEKDAAANLDTIDKGSQRMQISAKSYQELAYAAGLSGVEMGTMEKAAKNLQKTGEDLTLDAAIREVQSISDETERAARAEELFGAAAYQMTPLINAGAGSFEEMADEAHKLGLVFDDETVTAGANMGDMFSKVEQSISTLKTGLITELMPYVIDILQWVIDEMPTVKAAIRNFLDSIMPIVRPVLDGIKALLEGFFALMNGDISGFFDGFFAFIDSLWGAMCDIGEKLVMWIWEGVKRAWTKLVDWLRDAWQNIKDEMSNFGDPNTVRDGMNHMHAGGLPYVPYDGYQATLHRGEAVMTASDSQSLLAAVRKIAEGGGQGGSINITVQSILDGQIIGESVTQYQRNRARAYG